MSEIVAVAVPLVVRVRLDAIASLRRVPRAVVIREALDAYLQIIDDARDERERADKREIGR